MRYFVKYAGMEQDITREQLVKLCPYVNPPLGTEWIKDDPKSPGYGIEFVNVPTTVYNSMLAACGIERKGDVV